MLVRLRICTISPTFRRGAGLPLPLHLILPSPQPLQNHNRPSPRTTFLPPLSKGGGLTARHKLLLCCVLLATRPPFLFAKLFCRQDGGIATPPLAHTNPPKTALSLSLFVMPTSVCTYILSHPHYPLLSTTSLPLNERFVGFASLQSLWAFNFGHPCPPSKKGEVLLLGQAEPTMVGIAPYPHHQ